MKQTITLATCILLSGMSFAQSSSKAKNDPATIQRNLVATGKCELTGRFTDARNHPLKGVEVFIYEKDSSISASGFSDSTGRYETNAVLPGLHNVKLAYPGAKMAFIPNVPMKKGFNPLSLKADAPAADTTLDVATVMPDAVKKTKGGTTTTVKSTTTTTTTKTTTTTTKVPKP